MRKRFKRSRELC